MKDMVPPDQIRERRHTVGARFRDGTSNLLFSYSRLTDVAAGRRGVVVDALRICGTGITLGRVISGGHEIVLEDPDSVTVLIPEQGHILMDIDGTEQTIAGGTMALVEAERRRTRVIAPKGGLFVATTLLVPRAHRRSVFDGASPVAGRPLAREIDTPFGRHLRRLLPDLASDVFRRGDRLFSPRARDEFVGLIQDLLSDSEGRDIAPIRRGGGISEFRRVSRACDIIHDRSDEPLSLTGLADELQVTPRCLQLSFESVHGMSPRDYLQRVRLDRARALLLAQGEAASVTRAAMESGFLHLGRFSQAYRRAFGELPNETLGRRGSPRSTA